MGKAETTAATFDVEIEGLDGGAALADLFPSPWIESHYEVASIGEFLKEGEFAVTDQDFFGSIPTYELDRYVDASTEFDNWRAMLSAGIERYVLEQGVMGEVVADAADEVEVAEEDDSTDAKTEDSLEAGVWT